MQQAMTRPGLKVKEDTLALKRRFAALWTRRCWASRSGQLRTLAHVWFGAPRTPLRL